MNVEAQLRSDIRLLLWYIKEEKKRQLKQGFQPGELMVALSDADALLLVRSFSNTQLPSGVLKRALMEQDPWQLFEQTAVRVFGMKVVRKEGVSP